MFFHFLSFSFIFFHIPSFSFIFIHFLSFSLSLSGAQNLIFFGLNFVTISLDISHVKNQFLGPSRVIPPLGPLFLFFPLFFSSRVLSFLLAFYFFISSHFLFISSFFDFQMFFIFFFIFSEEKVSSFLFSCISFKYF